MYIYTMAPSLESMEAKLDMLLANVAEIKVLQTKVNKLEATVEVLSSTVAALSKEVTILKEKENNRDQLSRSNAVRLFGLSVSEEEDGGSDAAKSLTKRVYDTIIKPVLAAAKFNKQLETLPSLPNAFSEVYRVKVGAKPKPIVGMATGPPPPPPIIIKFATPAVRMAFLRNKKASLPSPTVYESANGTKRYTVVEDLTAVTYKKMREMSDSPEVDKVWSIDGKLRFTVPGDKSVYKVKSVFQSLSEIVSG